MPSSPKLIFFFQKRYLMTLQTFSYSRFVKAHEYESWIFPKSWYMHNTFSILEKTKKDKRNFKIQSTAWFARWHYVDKFISQVLFFCRFKAEKLKFLIYVFLKLWPNCKRATRYVTPNSTSLLKTQNNQLSL